MTWKWGLGIEKETAFIGYDNNLTNFTHEQNSGGPNGTFRFADWAHDGTVVGNREPKTKFSIIGMQPKEMIVGFHKDLDRGADQIVRPSRQHKHPIPFGSVPDMASRAYGANVPGSYHFNVTMPYENDMSSADWTKYKDKLKRGLLNVRAIQPLLFAMIGGTTSDSIGNPSHLEGSQRMLYSTQVSSYGTAKLEEGRNAAGGEVWPFKGIDESSGESLKYLGGASAGEKWRTNLRADFSSVGGSSYADIMTKHYTHGIPTIEYRFPDVFDTRGLYSVFSVMCSALENGKHTEKYTDPATSAIWTKAMEEIAKEGWDAQVDIAYLKLLKRNLKLSFDIPKTKTMRADKMMELVSKSLWEKNKDGDWVKPWIPERDTPVIHNFNKDSWEFYFIRKLKSDSSLKTKVINFLRILDRIDASRSEGKVSVMWPKKGKPGFALRDVFLDEKVIGIEFGAEDTEDILHCLARYKFVKLFENAGGQITAVKKLYNGDEEIKTLMERMLNEKEMLNLEQGGLLEVDAEAVREAVEQVRQAPTPPPEITPPVTPTEPIAPVVRRRPILNEEQFRIVDPDFTVAEDDNFNIADFKDVIEACGFTHAGNRIQMYVKFAKVTYGSSTINAYWKYTSHQSVTLYLNKIFTQRRTLLSWAETMRDMGLISIYSENTTSSSVWADNVTAPQFFDRLIEEARLWSKHSAEISRREQQSKTVIPLTRAGIQRLHELGINIVSIGRGKKYALSSRWNKETKDMHILKSVPYWKDMFVEIDNFNKVVSLKRKGVKHPLSVIK